MANTGFYLKMAAQNLVKNKLFYLPFLLTGSLCAAMCYIMRYLSYNELIGQMPDSVYVMMMLSLGSVIMAFLAVWIMAYANGFVIRRRRRELALYRILGLEKRHIARVLGLEMLILAAACILCGVVGGALLAKLVLLLLLRLMRFSVPLGVAFCVRGGWETAAAFLLLFGALYLYNLFTVQRASPLELLKSGSAGEQQPKSRYLLAAVGVAALLGGYAISFFTTDLLMVILLFFVAVALVIVGTHCLFGAGSVVLLKALRKNRRFYYQSGNFTAVSGLIYRMNQNARGLANICILATTVLVSVATTVCLYVGSEDSLNRNFPHEVALEITLAEEVLAQSGGDEAALTAYDTVVRTAAQNAGCDADAIHGYRLLSLNAGQPAPGVWRTEDSGGMGAGYFTLIPLADYNRLTGQSLTLAAGEALAVDMPEMVSGQFSAGDCALTVTGSVDTPGGMKSFTLGGKYVSAAQTGALVVPDTATLAALCRGAAAGGSAKISYTMTFDPEGLSDTALEALGEAVNLAANNSGNAADPVFGKATAYTFVRASMRHEYYNMFGSFLFLGLFLALMFTTATVLIIYYKQLSEGYEDRARFVILQQVGMSAAEVRGTIRRQVVLVFFLPLAMAGVHVAAAFPLLCRMLSAFGLNDLGLFAACNAATLVVFALCYVAVYALTAQRYYKIVRM